MNGNPATGILIKPNGRKKEERSKKQKKNKRKKEKEQERREKENEKEKFYQLYISEDHYRDLWKNSGWACGLE